MQRVTFMPVVSGDKEDRLSALPDGVLCHILSFLDTKYAIQTSVLSKRFVNLWASVPALNFDSISFSKLSSFATFIDRVLTLREDSVQIDSFSFSRRGTMNFGLLKKVMSYAVSHNVQHLNIFLEHNGLCGYPTDLYTSNSLKTLKLMTYGDFRDLKQPLCFAELTVLHLERVLITQSKIFSSCPNLIDLTLIDCHSRTLDTLEVRAPQLTKLTISCSYFWQFGCNIILSTPRLASFFFYGSHPLKLCMDKTCLVETVSIDVHQCHFWTATKEAEQKATADLISMLQRLRGAKFVTLSLGTIEVLAKFPDLLISEPSPFDNMKSLKFKASKRRNVFTIPTHVMTYLINRSPNAEISMGSLKCKLCNRPKRCKRKRH